MTKIILITGGQRSGKSMEAERRALSLSAHPVYMATAHIWDEEFRQRVKKHQERRGPEWTNIEEERWLSRHDVAGRVVLVDCITLWLTNLLFAEENAAADVSESINEHVLTTAKAELERLLAQEATFVFVTNEIGLGGVSENKLQRQFTDLQGAVNQFLATRADEVFLMVSGIPVKIK